MKTNLINPISVLEVRDLIFIEKINFANTHSAESSAVLCFLPVDNIQ